MTPPKFILSLCLLCLMLSSARAPVYVLDINERFYEKVEGGLWAKKRAYDGFKEFATNFGHTREEIWELIRKETDGKFHVTAYNKRTKARGLMQIRKIALQDIPGGWKFFKWKKISETSREQILKRKRVYDPYWNLYAGCAYLRRCKQMARRNGAQTIGRFTFSTNELARAFYVTGYGSWHLGVSATLKYMQE